VVSGSQGPTEEIEALLYAGAEFDNDTGHRTTLGLGNVQAGPSDVGVIEDVAHYVLLEDLFPKRVIVGGGLVSADAEEFLTQGEHGAVAVWIIEAEAAFDDRPLIAQVRKGGSETCVA
jgi:hypothetical protein